MSATALTGVFPVLQTPWRDDECLDQPTLQREVDWVLEVGCHGVTLGMVSEVQRLASEERDALTEAVCQAVAGRVPVIASVGAESGHTARRHARRAEQYLEERRQRVLDGLRDLAAQLQAAPNRPAPPR